METPISGTPYLRNLFSSGLEKYFSRTTTGRLSANTAPMVATPSAIVFAKMAGNGDG